MELGGGAERVVWRDGDWVPWSDATVHVLAQSLQRGSLAFDYLRVHRARGGTAIFRLRDHIARLFKTCSIMGLPIAYSPAELIEGCVETVRRNSGGNLPQSQRADTLHRGGTDSPQPHRWGFHLRLRC